MDAPMPRLAPEIIATRWALTTGFAPFLTHFGQSRRRRPTAKYATQAKRQIHAGFHANHRVPVIIEAKPRTC